DRPPLTPTPLPPPGGEGTPSEHNSFCHAMERASTELSSFAVRSESNIPRIFLAVKPQQGNPLHDMSGDGLQQLALDRPVLELAQVERCAKNHPYPRGPQPGPQHLVSLRYVLDVGRINRNSAPQGQQGNSEIGRAHV